MGVIEGTNQVGSGLSMGRRRVAVAEYDFDTDGGGTGDITLRGDSLPSGALVVEAFVETTEAFTSGGSATVALKAEGSADINSADAISGDPWNSTGVFRADALVGADAGFATTAERSIVATVATADLTAGACTVIVEYYEVA